jgi:MFS transporter, ACS family, tartrate transporter
MFIRTPVQFYAMRFLLGVAEAGFFPGVIYYLGLWFPATYRARAISGILIGIPLSQVVGAPLGGALLGLTGVAHLSGWQWIFLVEGLPPIFLGFIALGYLTNRPGEARWLSTQQRDWLSNCLEHEGPPTIAAQASPLRALGHPLLWILIVPYFALCAIGYGAAAWTPLLVRDALGTINATTGLLVGGIYLLAALVYPLAGMLSDRWDDRCGWAALGLLFYGVGGIGVALLPHSILRLVALMVMHVGNPLFHCSFWCVPTKFLKGSSAAAGIALISSIGTSGGFFGPSIIGFLKDRIHSDSAAFLGLAVLALFGAIVCIGLRRAAFRPGGRSAIDMASTNNQRA